MTRVGLSQTGFQTVIGNERPELLAFIRTLDPEIRTGYLRDLELALQARGTLREQIELSEIKASTEEGLAELKGARILH